MSAGMTVFSPVDESRSWLRADGDELVVDHRRYTHASGASIAVHSIPAVAPGGVWYALWQEASEAAAGRPVAVALDASTPARSSLSAVLWGILERHLRRVGWYRDWAMVSDLVGAMFILPTPGRIRLAVRGLRAYRSLLRVWDLGRDGDPRVASGPHLTGSAAHADWVTDIPWHCYGAVMASPHRAEQIHDHLTELGFSVTGSDHVAVGRWQGIQPSADRRSTNGVPLRS